MVEGILRNGKKYMKPEERFEIDVYEGRATDYRGEIVKWRRYERQFEEKRKELEEKGFLHIRIRKSLNHHKGIVRITDFEGLKDLYTKIMNKRCDMEERIALFKKYQKDYITYENDLVLDEILLSSLDDIVNEYDEFIEKENKRKLDIKASSKRGRIKGGKHAKEKSQKAFEETEFLRKHRSKSKELRLVNETICELKIMKKY